MVVAVGEGHYDRVVLGAAQCLNPFIFGRVVDDFRDGRRADETNGLHARVGQQRIDRFLVAIDEVEHAIRQARLVK